MTPETRKAVRIASHKWKRAAEAALDARLALIAEVERAVEAGVSEYDLADVAGVSRGTIRAWLGK